MNHLNASRTNETELFFRQWLRSPKSMGAVIPSSRVLARAVTEAIHWRPGQYVIELGAGTGAISQGLIDAGLPHEALMMIELDRPLFEYLRGRFPAVRVVNGDATRLADIVRQQGITEVGTVISGLPMVTMPFAFQRAIIHQSLDVLGDDGCLLQYSYSPVSPIPARKLGVDAKLVKFVVRNVPPATLWRFRRRANGPVRRTVTAERLRQPGSTHRQRHLEPASRQPLLPKPERGPRSGTVPQRPSAGSEAERGEAARIGLPVVISATVDVCEVACRVAGLFWEHSAEIQRLKKASSITHGHHALKEWLARPILT